MTALRDIQAAFLHDIYTGERTSLTYLDSKTASPGRLDIYENNTVLGLMDILGNAFPVVKKIVGEEFFKTIARHYIKNNAQPSGNRHTFGSELAAFLTDFEPKVTPIYVSDVAALEWAYFQAALADDATPFDFEALSLSLSTDPAFSLSVHPSVFIVSQHFNALDIWQEHQKEDIGLIRLNAKPHQIIVWRGPEDAVFMRPVSEALATLVEQSKNNTSFAIGMSLAAEKTGDMQKFQQEFAEAVSLGVFALKIKEAGL